MLQSLRCCLNPKVIGGLIAVGLVLWLFAPGSGTAAVPLLITLICPLSMGVMAWRMRRGGGCATPEAGHTAEVATEKQDVEVVALREELAIERARQQLARPNGQPPD